MRPQIHRIVFRVAISLLVFGAISLTGHSAFAAGRANYVEVAAWDTGYQAEYRITNDGPGDLTAWTVVFDLPTNNGISSSWDSVLARSGTRLVFRNAAWNGSLRPGESTSFGFVVVGLARPTNCTINGGPCDTFAPLANAAPHRRPAPAPQPSSERRIAAVTGAVPAGDRDRRGPASRQVDDALVTAQSPDSKRVVRG